MIDGLIGKDIVDELLEASKAFLVPLRIGDGFDEDKFNHLCHVLRKCREAWINDDMIPRVAVNVLVDLFSATQGCSYLYKGTEAEKIMQAAHKIDVLVAETVPLKGADTEE